MHRSVLAWIISRAHPQVFFVVFAIIARLLGSRAVGGGRKMSI